MLKPGAKTPDLSVKTVGGETWTLAEQQPENFTMIVFYRGYHCPICKPYLRELDRKLEEFGKLGVDVIAISSDNQERAEKTYSDWQLKELQVGYGLPLEKARDWGLYISKGIKEPEPAEFSEPGLVLIQPDQTLYAASIQTMPFARPKFDELLGALEFVLDNDYPPRGAA